MLKLNVLVDSSIHPDHLRVRALSFYNKVLLPLSLPSKQSCSRALSVQYKQMLFLGAFAETTDAVVLFRITASYRGKDDASWTPPHTLTLLLFSSSRWQDDKLSGKVKLVQLNFYFSFTPNISTSPHETTRLWNFTKVASAKTNTKAKSELFTE